MGESTLLLTPHNYRGSHVSSVCTSSVDPKPKCPEPKGIVRDFSFLKDELKAFTKMSKFLATEIIS